MRNFQSRGSQLSLLALLVFSILGIVNVHAGIADPPFLLGNKIGIMRGSLEFPVDEPCYVSQGWSWPDWQTRTQDIKGHLFNGAMGFKLYVDGVQMDLKRYVRYYPDGIQADPELGTRVMIVKYYIQFGPNTFTPGPHTFVGAYYDHSTLTEFTCYVTFTT